MDVLREIITAIVELGTEENGYGVRSMASHRTCQRCKWTNAGQGNGYFEAWSYPRGYPLCDECHLLYQNLRGRSEKKRNESRKSDERVQRRETS